MKKLYTTIVGLLAITQFSYAQWSTPGSGGVISYTGGPVGIGLANPVSPLDVLGTIATRNSTATTNNGISINAGNTNTPGSANVNRIRVGGNDTYAGYFTIQGPSNIDYFTLYNGNAGIGTTNPANRLDVQGGNASIYNAGNPTSLTIGSSLTGKTLLSLGTSADSNGYGNIESLSAGSSAYGNTVINQHGGQVGIGTTNLASVKVNNATDYIFNPGEARLMVVNTSSLSAYSDALVIRGSSTLQATHSQGILFADANSMQAAIRAKRLNQSANYQSDLQFYTGDGTSTFQDEANVRMTISHSGNVGIGTENPDQKLTVNGTVHSSAVIVNTSIPIPDYVFKSSYNLLSLAEVKTYIDKNHHLPDVPSAAQIDKNGLNLGDMNTVLLKKVEELTLYLIEKDKQVEALQKQIDQLAKKINQ